jgi:co-chaperonin GroES (HSP10)
MLQRNKTKKENIMLKPLKSKMIVSLIGKETVTESGIILSRADASEVNRGLVLDVGPDVKDVKNGDFILPNWNKAQKTSYDGETYYIVDEEDVVLVFE